MVLGQCALTDRDEYLRYQSSERAVQQMIVQDRLAHLVYRYLVVYQAVQNAPQGHYLE